MKINFLPGKELVWVAVSMERYADEIRKNVGERMEGYFLGLMRGTIRTLLATQSIDQAEYDRLNKLADNL